jgi:predicted DNA binding protein
MKRILIQSKPEHSWLKALAEKFGNDLLIDIIDCRPLINRRYIQSYFRIYPSSTEAYSVMEIIKNSEDVVNYEFLEENNLIYGSVITKRCKICSILAKCGCIFRKIKYEKGIVTWDMIGSKENIKLALNLLKNNNIKFEIKNVYNYKSIKTNNLTLNQEKVLSLAYKLGYFDFPRKISLSDLAKILNLSPSTLDEKIRKSVKKVLDKYFNLRQIE